MNTIEKPKKVSFAVNILIISLICVTVNLIIDQMINALEMTPIIITVFAMALNAFFIYKIHLGKKWALITFLVFFIIGTLITLGFIINTELNMNDLFSVVTTLLDFSALLMLFSKESSEWFNTKKQISY